MATSESTRPAPPPSLRCAWLSAYRIKPSADRVWDSDPEWWLKAFPHLFPFGRGGPNEARRTRVSVEACMEHYLRLSTGQFQGYEFALHGYDVVARQQLGRRAYLQTKLRSGGVGGLRSAAA